MRTRAESISSKKWTLTMLPPGARVARHQPAIARCSVLHTIEPKVIVSSQVWQCKCPNSRKRGPSAPLLLVGKAREDSNLRVGPPEACLDGSPKRDRRLAQPDAVRIRGPGGSAPLVDGRDGREDSDPRAGSLRSPWSDQDPEDPDGCPRFVICSARYPKLQ